VSQGLTSPSAIAIQVGALAALVVMIKIDWIKVIDWTRARVARMRGKPAPPSVRPPGISLPEKREAATRD
jgi:hypothetical protein